MKDKLYPKKDDIYKMCKHIAAAGLAGPDLDLASEHWFYFPNNPPQRKWASLCGACFAKAERHPGAPLPLTHEGELAKDVEIDYDGVN